MRDYGVINFGPWDRIDGNEPFVPGAGPKPAGARFYPEDMTVQEFEAGGGVCPDGGEALKSLYTLVRREIPRGTWWRFPIPRHSPRPPAVPPPRLKEAAALAEDPGLKRYLELRAGALLSDNYQASDFAWMDMKDNGIDVVIGPIETYEDQLFGYKASHEAFVLVKDREWSERLARYAEFLPELQRGLPVPPEYKAEISGRRRGPECLRRGLRGGRRQCWLEDHRHQPSQRSGGTAAQGGTPPSAQERNAGEVRPDPCAHRRCPDGRGSAGTGDLRCVLREHDVPRGLPRSGDQEHDQRNGTRPSDHEGTGVGSGGGKGRHSGALHDRRAAGHG